MAEGAPGDGSGAQDGLPAYLTRGRARAARRRFLAGGGSALAAMASVPLLGAAAPRASATGGQGAADVADVPLPPYRSRAEWGADERLRRDPAGASLWPVVFFPVQTVTIHHTTGPTPSDEDEAAVLVADVYREHAVEAGFGDIGYHLLVGPGGVVYEGRYSGGTNFPVFDVWPGGGQAPAAVNGAHVHNHNAGNVGIALLGDFSWAEPTEAAWWSLARVVALLVAAGNLDPLAVTEYRNPVNGMTRWVPCVAGHDEWTGTDCPGASVGQWLSWLRAEAGERAAGLRGSWMA